MITGAIKRTSRDRLYQELGLKSLADRRWSRRLFFFHKITQGLLPSYLQTYHNAVSEGAYLTRSTTQNKIKPIPARTNENSFFPNCIKKWSKLNDKIRNIELILFSLVLAFFIQCNFCNQCALVILCYYEKKNIRRCSVKNNVKDLVASKTLHQAEKMISRSYQLSLLLVYPFTAFIILV